MQLHEYNDAFVFVRDIELVGSSCDLLVDLGRLDELELGRLLNQLWRRGIPVGVFDRACTCGPLRDP